MAPAIGEVISSGSFLIPAPLHRFRAKKMFVLVGGTGFEPVTFSVSGRRAPAAPTARDDASLPDLRDAPAAITTSWLEGCQVPFRYRRRRRESNPCTGLCRPLPKPLGHSATEAARPTPDEAAARRLAMDSENRGLALRCSASPSGRRDSNPRPSPWQGDALPTEPRPHASQLAGRRRERARRANRTVADPGRRANSGAVEGPACVASRVRILRIVSRLAGNVRLATLAFCCAGHEASLLRRQRRPQDPRPRRRESPTRCELRCELR
jgi:hypothetical protein